MLQGPGSHSFPWIWTVSALGRTAAFVTLTAITAAAWMTQPVTFPSLCTALPPLPSHNVKLGWACPPYLAPAASLPPGHEESLL